MTLQADADRRAARHCYKCGREIGPDESICDVCNRAGMATPSASQYHGTIVVAIVVAVVALAIWASLAQRGIGPYGASVVAVTSDPPDGALISLRVTNEGTQQGYAKCLVTARGSDGSTLRSRSVTLGPIAGGAVSVFEERLAGLEALPSSVAVECT